MRDVPKYIDPLGDLGMKRLFSPETRPENLIALLNALLPGDRRIRKIAPLGTEKVAASVQHKTVYFDLACEDAEGNVFVVEVQRIFQRSFRKRLVYYGARQIERLVQRGSRAYDYPEVTVVALLDFAEPDVDRALYNVYLTTDYGELWTRQLAFTIVNLGNFDKHLSELRTPAEDWMYLLKHLPAMTETPTRFKTPVFERLLSDAEYDQLSQRDKDAYFRWWDARAVRQGQEEWLLEQGIERGIEQGIEQIVKTLDAKGKTIEEIVELTDLPLLRVRDILA